MSATTTDMAELAARSGVAFGTSGARGLVSALSDRVCYAYALAFCQHLAQGGRLEPAGRVAIGGDLRPSTPRILAAVAQALADRGLRVEHCGALPSPALALHGLAQGIPTVMVTGSHIPDDRNGIKFNTAAGEIDKADEAGILAQRLALPAERFDGAGALRAPAPLPAPSGAAAAAYVRRYLDFLPDGSLAGLRLGVFQHSAVGRDLFVQVLAGLGAEVLPLGRVEHFVPVDTEAVRPADHQAARAWAAGRRLDAILSSDGDSDRPLLADEAGAWLRGDVLGILAASWLGAAAVATPVSCSSAVERCGRFARVLRTRIGSPYVIAGMQALADAGLRPVVGYEANGGFLLQHPIAREGRVLAALPTRDALLPQLAALLAARAAGLPLSGLVASLPARYSHSERLERFPLERSHAALARLRTGSPAGDRAAAEALLGALYGPVREVDHTDGARVTFASEDVIHLRPSGNAPELRCYSEADSAARAAELARRCLPLLESWRADRA